MANHEHVDILRQGLEIWNAWRKMYPEIRPDLSNTNLFRAFLSNADLDNANLSYAILSHADLSRADLSHTDLSSAYLNHANLNRANLSHADLSHTDLSHTNLSSAYLNYANLSYTDLNGTNLSHADLNSTNLSHAPIGWAIFGNLDLRTVKGLETTMHQGPSSVGIDTIYRSGGNIPKVFLRGTGIDDTFIEYMHSLVGKPIEYNSCFIGYSSKNEDFAKRLYADLQNNNVRCWYAPEDMKTGDRIRPRIYEQIWFNDKLLLVLSDSSVKSSWVEYEVETALARERKEKRDILFPIRLDDAVMESTTAWAAHIQDARHITDFTRWKEHDEYQTVFYRLLRDLKQDTVSKDAY